MRRIDDPNPDPVYPFTPPAADLPVTPQEAAFQALAAADPAASATPAEKAVAFEWLRSVAMDDDDPHREDAAALLYELARPGRVSRIDVTTSEDTAPVYLPTAHDAGPEAATMLLLTLQLTEGRDGEHSAGHVSTIGVVSREALQPSIKLLAQCEDAFSVLNAPRFIRHRLLAVSTICELTPEAIELADLVDLQSLVHASASELACQKREGKS